MADQEYKVKISVDGAQKAQADVGGVDRALGGMGKAALAAGAALFTAGGVVAGIRALGELSDRATRVDKVAAAFDGLTAKAKFTGNTLAQLQAATRGTVSDFELMRQTNNALLLGVGKSSEQMAEMAEISRRLGAAMGLDTAQALESLVIGIGRQSRLFLDNLGIVVDVDVAYRKYADTLGKSVDQLNDYEKKLAFTNETMISARKLVAGLGADSEVSGDKVKVLRTEWENLKDSMDWVVDVSVSTIESFNDLRAQIGAVSDAISGSFLGTMWESWRVWNLNNTAVKEADGAFTQLIETHRTAAKATDDSATATAKSAEAIAAEAKAAQTAYEQYVSREVLKDEISARMAEREKDRMDEFARLSEESHAKARDIAAWNEQDRQDQESQAREVADRYKEYGDKQAKGAIETAKLKKQAWIETTGIIIGSIASLNQSFKGAALVTKRILQAEAIVNTYAAANKALVFGPGPPLTLPLVAGVIAQGLANVGQIQSQSYREGGVIEGSGGPRQDNQQVNVSRGESILNAEATSRLGRDGIDRLNGGGGAGITLNFNGPFIGTESFVRDTVLPMLEAKLTRRLA